MGCIYSRKDINDIHPRMFRVVNVDDQGFDLSPGKIEVSDMELILHQKGKEPIRWPWRCLRRYGFDQELFSFESGRRCPLGPGIYAFRCKRAERLFLLVQECIQRAGHEDQVHLSQSVISATVRTNSRPTSVVETQDSNGFAPHPPISQQPVSVAEGNGVTHLYVNGPAANEMNDPGNGTVNYSNVPDTSLIDLREAPEVPERINYAVLDLPKSTENLSEEPPARPPAPINNGEVHYANTDPDAFSEGLPLSAAVDADVFIDEEAEADVQANYINVTSKINYIQLDLNRSSENVANGATATPTSPSANTNPPDSPTKRNAERESYVTIDFHKTTALHNSGKGTVEEEEGSRKTRHSSTISELN